MSGSVSPVRAGLTCRCPRCGKGRLFDGFLEVRDGCGSCGLSYANVDTGDGPAVFVILVVGFMVVGAALLVEVKYHPPYWLHLVVWIPAILASSLGLLRPAKALLIALTYKYRRD